MKSDHKHIYQNRKNTRLPGYDYCKPGGYFVTICAAGMAHLFGKICQGVMIPNKIGSIIKNEWFRTKLIRLNVELYKDEFVLMPNHLHGIIWILDSRATTIKRKSGPTPGSLGAIVSQFKSQSTRKVNRIRGMPGKSIWQRNYYDHIIRNDTDLSAIQKYILNNPLMWEEQQKDVYPWDI